MERPAESEHPAETGEYPAEWESDVLLSDGSTAHVRPVRPEDADAHEEFISRLSTESSYFRFFTPRRQLTDEETERFVTVDYHDRLALAVFVGDEMVAIASYDRIEDTTAEVAFLVEDGYQGRGLGTLLLEHLAAAADERGITRFVADVLPENRRMLDVFQHAGFHVVDRFAEGVIRVTFPIQPTSHTLELFAEREHRAEATSVARVLEPASVAVIGASNTRGTVGHHLFLNLLRNGFQGPVYPVNPGSEHVASVRAYPTVLEVPDEVDLAVVAVPAARVEEVVEQCADKGVHGLVIVSAGFAEVGGEGVEREQGVLDAARRGGMRLIGPNCIGVVNTSVGLNATFAPHQPIPGRVGFLSQSGALGIAILEWSSRLGLGISSFVSVGNKADVSGNDLLQYWEDDPATDVILFYLESFGNPRKFSRIARRVARRKPIVAVKSGRTSAGTRAASSHTAAMASSDVAVNALFHQTGVIRVDTLEQLLDTGQVLATQPIPEGRRVAIVSNSGGPGILAADACEGAGLVVAELTDETTAKLRSFLGPAASVRNPVDMVASAGADDYERALKVVLADANVDAVIVIFTPPLVTEASDVAQALVDVCTSADKPVLANFVAAPEAAELLSQRADGGRPIPVFRSPEPAALALGRIADWAEWRRRDPGTIPDLEVDTADARELVEGWLAGAPEGGRWLDADQAVELLDRYGIPAISTIRADTADAAVEAAEASGYPIALKSAAGDVVHKTERGGLRLGLESADEVRTAFTGMRDMLGRHFDGTIVQPMARPGTETIVGVTQDPSFGPLVMFGMGGIITEVIGDRALRTVPLTTADAAELVRSIRGAPLLFGYRGSPPTDIEALEQLLLRVSRMAEDLPELADLDLNPVIAGPEGPVVVDAKARLTPVETGPPPTVRRL